MDAPRITSVRIYNHPVQGDLEIGFHGKKHLILTGPNGSGKSTILESIDACLNAQLRGRGHRREWIDFRDRNTRTALSAEDANAQHRGNRRVREAGEWLARSHVDLDWNIERESLPGLIEDGFLAAFLRADRRATLAVSEGPRKLVLKVADIADTGIAFLEQFVQYLVNLHTTMHLLSTEEPEEARRIAERIEELEGALSDLFVAQTVRFSFDKRTYALGLVVDGKPQPWQPLAAGHQAALHVVAELFTRSHAVEGRSPEAGGVVLIDEPELHLHPEMQEVVLPVLTRLFPNLQFIVATHAPPCVSSIRDAWVFDLRDREGVASEELMGRPYGLLMRAHFQVPTDYDEETTRIVEHLLERARESLAPQEKRALRDELAGLLVTQDPRVRDAWMTLSLELEAS